MTTKEFVTKYDLAIIYTVAALVVIAFLGFWTYTHYKWVAQTKPLQFIELPEEISLATKGDTLYIHRYWDETVIGFSPIDDNDRMYVVK